MLVEIFGKRGEEQLLADSREIAKHFEKEHRHILKTPSVSRLR